MRSIGGVEVRRIEVKGRKRGGNLVLTTNEWFKAQQLGEHYWPCVVWDPLGQVLPPPTLVAEKRCLQGVEVAVVTVQPADAPPVRYQGRVWIRIGPRRGVATAQDERILKEKRRYRDLPFDVQPGASSSLGALSRVLFEEEYLPNAFAPDVVASNERTYEQRLSARKMVAVAESPVPTALGLLVIGKSPRDLLPGAYSRSGKTRPGSLRSTGRFSLPQRLATSRSPFSPASAEVSIWFRATLLWLASRKPFPMFGRKARAIGVTCGGSGSTINTIEAWFPDARRLSLDADGTLQKPGVRRDRAVGETDLALQNTWSALRQSRCSTRHGNDRRRISFGISRWRLLTARTPLTRFTPR